VRVCGLVFGLLVALLGACSPASTATPSFLDLSVALRGTAWTAVSIAGVAPLPAHEPSIEFDDVGVRGSTGCNDWGGLPTFGAGSALTITEISTTKKACDPAVGAQEAAFLAALRGTTSLTTDGTSLQVHGTGGDIVFRPGVGLGGTLDRA
jgi:heat shock protein HslJ